MPFGLSVWARHISLPALALFLSSQAACNDKPAADLGFGVSFACEADHEQSDALRLRILAAGCATDNKALYDETLAKGASAPAANNISPGTYGIEGTALSAGEELAFGCLVAVLPTTQTLNVVLESDNCDDELDGGEPDGDVDAGAMDAGDLDASDDAESDALIDEDAGDAGDAEIDAAPIPCTESCDDGVICTDDSCDTTSGKCVHMPFNGARECDGIACTQNDQCTDGTCAAGAPNNGACVDDGQVCTAEVCAPGVGCTHPTAGANGRDCNDNIGCTGSDKCSNGICRGTTDTCIPMGKVCGASGACISTACTVSCDDGNPCTTDECVSGTTCTHNSNTAACNDGKDCTINDVCSNKACAGTNTCPSDATCNNFCGCNDTAETLCSNACLNLTNTPSNCGSCTRACGSGQSCENSACKPGNAPTCTAHRNGGHDYLFCTETVDWPTARARCRSWSMGLAIVDNSGENQFIQQRIGSAARWLGANDRGDNGSKCGKDKEEGTWWWANPTSTEDNGTQFCALASDSATSCTVASGRYQNWNSGEPNNSGCNPGACIPFLGCGAASEGEDCGMMQADGTWNDSKCGDSLGYVCESP